MLGTPNRPAVGVSLYEAAAYCKWLSGNSPNRYRLPDDAEWKRGIGVDFAKFWDEFVRWRERIDVKVLGGGEPDEDAETVIDRLLRDEFEFKYCWRKAGRLQQEVREALAPWLTLTPPTLPVGLLPRLSMRVGDLFGNVWEWCDTWAVDPEGGDASSPRPPPSAAKGGRGPVLVNGCPRHRTPANFLYVGGRCDPMSRLPQVGFRVCRAAD